MTSIDVAVAQLPITGDARENGRRVRDEMVKAAAGGARLIHFPEGMLSGYAKSPIQDWAEVDWNQVRDEAVATAALAGRLGIWVVLGSAHPLTPPHRPHNSLYVIDERGELINRYDKRLCSYTEITRFYTPGFRPVVFDVDGYRFGCATCIEVNFPALFAEYDELGVDCVLLSAYPIDAVFLLKARALAAIHNYWLSVSVAAECEDLLASGLIDPNGEIVGQVAGTEGLLIGTLDRTDPALDIPLNKARPWRTRARSGEIYRDQRVTDQRSADLTAW